MPKRKKHESPSEQAARFRAEVKRMIAAGELSPTEADAALDELVRGRASFGTPPHALKDG